MSAKSTKDEKSKKDEYVTMMESQIKKWDAEVDKLRAKGDQLSAEARAKYDQQLMAMRASRDAAQRKLQELRMASESAWQQMQAGADAEIAKISAAILRRSTSMKRS